MAQGDRQVKWLARLSIFIFLTAISQIGGIAYLASSIIAKLSGIQKRTVRGVLFVVSYAGFSIVAMLVAPVFGRVPLNCVASHGHNYELANPIFCILNRNYVTPELAVLIEKTANAVDDKFPGSRLVVLDANFPFIDGFPLLPHLSHDDGRKVDLAFFYRDKTGNYVPGHTPSPIGYWAFIQPRAGTNMLCDGEERAQSSSSLSLRWDLDFLQPIFGFIKLEENRTAMVLSWLVQNQKKLGLQKILLEPHLKHQLGLSSDIVRFQGCQAARHDDHFHIQTVH